MKTLWSSFTKGNLINESEDTFIYTLLSNNTISVTLHFFYNPFPTEYLEYDTEYLEYDTKYVLLLFTVPRWQYSSGFTIG